MSFRAYRATWALLLAAVGLVAAACTPKAKEGQPCDVMDHPCGDGLCFTGWMSGTIAGDHAEQVCMTERKAQEVCQKSVKCAKQGYCNIQSSGMARVCIH
jgi:hypothetical protein